MKETAREYLLRYAEGHAERFRRVEWVEEDVQFNVGEEAVITGRIDLACRTERGLEIIDFKVRSRKGLDVLRPDLQVQTYGLACQESRGVKVDRLIVHLLTEPLGSELEEFPWDAAVAENARQTLSTSLQGIWGAKFEPNPGAHCVLCDFRALCPAAYQRPSGAISQKEMDEPNIGACP